MSGEFAFRGGDQSRPGGVNCPVRLIVTRFVAFLLLVCAIYCAWASHRSELWLIAHDPSWPRAFPYPDHGVRALERYWDGARPPLPGTIKLHGEFPRVQRAAGIVAIVCATAGGLFLIPTLLQIRIRTRSNKAGFPSSTKNVPFAEE
jgi:hypothetical protein